MKPDTSTEKQIATPMRRIGQLTLSLLNPLSDVMVIYRKGVEPTIGKLKSIPTLISKRTEAAENLTWQQAVDRSGKTAKQLISTFKRIQAGWWLVMAISWSLSIILLGMVLLANFSLPLNTFLRASVWFLILVALGGVGFVKSLIATYRIWQLTTKRGNEVEKGTFKDFLSENRWCLKVLSIGQAKN